MSYDVDSRIVEMKFDNKEFEADVSHTIKMLDKLNDSLQFEGAEKGFNEIEKASKGVKLDGLAASVEKIADRFTFLGTVQRKVFEDISNRIVGLEHKMESLIKSMSVDQIMAGWEKYADKTSSVQTIMAATSNEIADTGERMKYVNEQLKILNWFTDETSHKYLDMVNNIGKFTANQVPLNQAVTAMQGIATWASKSGANANEASRAMYNLSQAISSGSLKLMDWKSIELANMATAEFKQTAIETGEQFGTLIKVAEGLWTTLDGTEVSVKNFRESLSSGWLDSNVLMGTLNKYGEFTIALREAVEATGMSTYEMLHAIDDYRDGVIDLNSMAEDLGMNTEDLDAIIGALADDSMQFGKQAFQAAQETKTFAEAIDYVKEAVSTGWMNTFEIIFGDYAEAKALWSNLSEWLYTVFVEAGDARNEVLELWKAIGGREELIKSIRNIRDAFDQVREAAANAWEDLFPKKTASDIYYITMLIRRLTDQLVKSDTAANGLYRIFKLLFSPIKTFATILKIALGIIALLVDKFNELTTGFLEIIGSGESVIDIIGRLSDESEILRTVFAALGLALNIVLTPLRFLKDIITRVLDAFKLYYGVETTAELFAQLGYTIRNGLLGALGLLYSAISQCFQFMSDHLPTAESLANAIGFIAMAFQAVGAVLVTVFGICVKVFGYMVKSITDLITGVKTFWDIVEEIGGFLFDKLGWLGEEIKKFFKYVFSEEMLQQIWKYVKAVKAFFDTLSTGQVVALILISSVVLFARQLRLLMKAITSVVNSFSGLEGILKSIKGYFTALTQAVKYSALLQIGAGFLLIASAMWILSKIPKDDLYSVAAVMGQMAIAIAVLMVAMSAINTASNNAAKIAGTMAAFGAGMLMIAGAMAIMKDVKTDPAMVINLFAAISAFVVGMAWLSRWVPQMEKIALEMVAYGAAMVLISKAFQNFATAVTTLKSASINGWELIGVISGIAAAVVAFGLAMRFMAKVNFGTGAGTMMLVGSFLLFLKVLEQIVTYGLKVGEFFDKFNDKFNHNVFVVLGIITAFGGIMALLAAVTLAVNKVSKDILIAGLGVTLAIASIKMAFDTIKSLNDEHVAMQGLLNFAIGFAAVIAAFWAISQILAHTTDLAGWKSLIAMAGLALAAAYSIKLLTDLPFADMLGSALTFGAVILAMGYAMKLANEGLEHSKTVMAFVAGIAAILVALSLLSLFFTGGHGAEVWQATGVLSASLLAMGAGMKLAGSVMGTVDWKAMLMGVLAAVAIGGTLVALAAMGADLNAAGTAAAGMGIAIATIGLAAKLAGQAKWESFLPLLAMCPVVLSIGVAMKDISEATRGMNFEELATRFGGLASCIVVLGLAVRLGEQGGLAQGAGTAIAMVAAAAAMYGVALSIAKISEFDWQTIETSAFALRTTIEVLTICVAALGALKGIAVGGALVLVAIAAACYGVAEAFNKFANATNTFAEGVEKITAAMTSLGNVSQATLASAAQNIIMLRDVLVDTINNVTPSLQDAMERSGQWTAIGFKTGLLKEQSNIIAAAKFMWDSFITAFNSSAGIASPSAVMVTSGFYTIAGFEDGVLGNVGAVRKAADGTWYAFKSEFDAKARINGTKCEVAEADGKIIVNGIAIGIDENKGMVGSAAGGIASFLSTGDITDLFRKAGLKSCNAYGGALLDTVSGYINKIPGADGALGGLFSRYDTSPVFLNENDEKRYKAAQAAGAPTEALKNMLGYDPKDSKSREAAYQKQIEDTTNSLMDGADAADAYADALSNAGGSAGSAGKATKEATEEAKESVEDILDVTQFASNAVVYFKEQYDAQAETLLDIAPWEKAIGATEDMVFTYTKLSGALGDELDAFDNFGELYASENTELAKKVRDTWTNAFDSIRSNISQGFGSVFSTPTFGKTDDWGLEITSFADMQSNLLYQQNQMQYFADTLVKLYKEGLNRDLVEELLNAGPENLSQIISWDQLTKEQIQEINKSYEKLGTTMDNLTMDVIMAQAENYSAGVDSIANTIYDQIANKDYSNIQNEVSQQTSELLERVLDADTNWEDFQGTRLGELLDEGIASGIDNMTEIATNACEQLGREMMQSMLAGIDSGTAGGSGGGDALVEWNKKVISGEVFSEVGDSEPWWASIWTEDQYNWHEQTERVLGALDLFGKGIENFDTLKYTREYIEGVGDLEEALRQARELVDSGVDLSNNAKLTQMQGFLEEAIANSTAQKLGSDTVYKSEVIQTENGYGIQIVQNLTPTGDDYMDIYNASKSALWGINGTANSH